MKEIIEYKNTHKLDALEEGDITSYQYENEKYILVYRDDRKV